MKHGISFQFANSRKNIITLFSRAKHEIEEKNIGKEVHLFPFVMQIIFYGRTLTVTWKKKVYDRAT